MTSIRYILFLFMAAILTSCGEESLQKYFVKKQDDPKFMKIDLAPSLLEGKNSKLGPEERETLKNIKKINVVAYQVKEGDKEDFEWEREELELILLQDRYKELTRIKSPGWNMSVNYTGTETAIDEVIVYAVNKKQGFAVFRLLGDDLKPEQIVQFILTAKESDLDLSELSGLQEIFK